MKYFFACFFVIVPLCLHGQSKSISQFRDHYKENTNMFFYSSTLKMLNTDNNPELSGLLNGIEEIRVLNYNKAEQKFKPGDVAELKTSLQKETYNNIMMINEKGNTVHVYSKDKKGNMTGLVAIVENKESVVLIDLIGSIDIKKFMQLKQQLDSRSGNPAK